LKLIIQVPCYNEAETLPSVVADLPRAIAGVDKIETLVINDGSTDGTERIARECGVDHVVNLPCNRGLAVAWAAGVEVALRAGADLIVNTDGDNQYSGADIPRLVEPILNGEAEFVIGSRPIESIPHFSWFRKRLQRIGSWVVSRFAGVSVPDAASGFRAYSREAAMLLNVISPYSHCMETLIRAARKGIRIKSVPINVNPKLRESRLMRSLPHYLYRQAVDIFRVFTMVAPLKVFAVASLLLFLPGLVGCIRYLYFFFNHRGAGHVQSLLLSVMLIILSFMVGLVGLAADMISANHRLVEDILYRLKRQEMASPDTADGKGRRNG